jgi:hypothetical protein
MYMSNVRSGLSDGDVDFNSMDVSIGGRSLDGTFDQPLAAVIDGVW